MLWHSALKTLLTSLGLSGSRWRVGHNLNRHSHWITNGNTTGAYFETSTTTWQIKKKDYESILHIQNKLPGVFKISSSVSHLQAWGQVSTLTDTTTLTLTGRGSINHFMCLSACWKEVRSVILEKNWENISWTEQKKSIHLIVLEERGNVLGFGLWSQWWWWYFPDDALTTFQASGETPLRSYWAP